MTRLMKSTPFFCRSAVIRNVPGEFTVKYPQTVAISPGFEGKDFTVAEVNAPAPYTEGALRPHVPTSTLVTFKKQVAPEQTRMQDIESAPEHFDPAEPPQRESSLPDTGMVVVVCPGNVVPVEPVHDAVVPDVVQTPGLQICCCSQYAVMPLHFHKSVPTHFWAFITPPPLHTTAEGRVLPVVDLMVVVVTPGRVVAVEPDGQQYA